MTAAATPPARPQNALLSIVSLLGGIPLAVIPAATLSISSHIYPLAEQGVISVAVLVATFVSQLASGAIVEARLSTSGLIRQVAFPRWLVWLSLAAAVVLAVFSSNAIVLCVCLPILVSGLEVGRGVSVAERLDRREVWAAIAVGLGALAGVLIALTGSSLALVALAVGIGAATLVRAAAVPHQATRADPVVRAWIMADVGLTGVIYPALNSVILGVLGPASATIFASISTVSGLLAIPINFLRTRLLKEHSLPEIVISVGALIAAVAVIAACELLGLFSFVFGAAWTLQATLLPLAVACLWRSASVLSTVPFASLRRRGRVRLLTVLRGVGALVTFSGAVAAVQSQQIVIVFVAFFGGELLQAVLYESARRRTNRGDAPEALAGDPTSKAR